MELRRIRGIYAYEFIGKTLFIVPSPASIALASAVAFLLSLFIFGTVWWTLALVGVSMLGAFGMCFQSKLSWTLSISKTYAKIPCTEVIKSFNLKHPVMLEAIEDYRNDPFKDDRQNYWRSVFDGICVETCRLEHDRVKQNLENTKINKNYVEQIKEERKLLGLDN